MVHHRHAPIMAGNTAFIECIQQTKCPVTLSVSHDGSPLSSLSQASMHSV